MKDFEFIEHTSDIGMRVYGDTYETLFENAAYGLLHLIGAPAEKIDRKNTLQLTAGSLEELLVRWLNELIGIIFADHFLPAQFEVNINVAGDDKTIIADISGCDFSPDNGDIKVEVKAVTYHEVKIEHLDKLYRAEVIIDV